MVTLQERTRIGASVSRFALCSPCLNRRATLPPVDPRYSVWETTQYYSRGLVTSSHLSIGGPAHAYFEIQ